MVGKNRKPYYVSYSHKSSFGKENGIKFFDTWQQAQNFAVKVDIEKSFQCNSWGTKDDKRQIKRVR